MSFTWLRRNCFCLSLDPKCRLHCSDSIFSYIVISVLERFITHTLVYIVGTSGTVHRLRKWGGGIFIKNIIISYSCVNKIRKLPFLQTCVLWYSSGRYVCIIYYGCGVKQIGAWWLVHRVYCNGVRV